MKNNKENVEIFKKRVEEIKTDLIKNTEPSILINILYKKILKNLKDQKDINNKSFVKSKWKKGSLLKKTGSMINSIKMDKKGIKIDGSKLDLIKAYVNNFGKTIEATKSKFLKIKFSGGFRNVKKVKIPKREFFPNRNSKISDEALKEFKEKILKNFK